jgi:hypothetical protein
MNRFDDQVYQELADYQKSRTSGWTLHDAMQHLHDWADIFRFRFKLEIPAVPLRLARLRWNCLGHFDPSFNDFGLQNEIAIDVGHLTARLQSGAWWQVLATLLHEQLHFWQQLNGRPSRPGRGNYHNVEYRERAARLGLVVSSRGVNEHYLAESPFLMLLKEKGVDIPALSNSPQYFPASRPRVGSKLKRWSCGCIPPVRLRVGRAKIRVRCMDCGQMFDPDIT